MRITFGPLLIFWILTAGFFLSTPQLASAISSGDQVPALIEGESLPTIRGRVTYLDFWASWCGACQLSLLWLNELQEKYGDKVQIIAINLDKDSQDAIPVLTELGPRFLSVLNPKGTIAAAFNLKAVPAAFLIDANGKVVHEVNGFRESEKVEIEAAIKKLLTGAS